MAEQKKLFGDGNGGPPNPFKGAKFGGSAYDKKLDHKRLTGKILKIFNFMKPGQWVDEADLERVSGSPGASATSLMRKLRTKRCGGHTIVKKRFGNPGHGYWKFKLTINPDWPQNETR